MNRFLLILILFSTLLACEQQPPEPDPEPLPSLTNRGVFILNEGNFQRGNASLDFYDLAADTLFRGVFEQANQRSLGDVLQSMLIHEGRGYLVVNNSQKIEVVDPFSLASLGTIEGLTSPRQMYAVSADRAYASDLYAGGVYRVNLNTLEVEDLVAIPGWNEEMVQVGDRLFIANYDDRYLRQINLDDSLGSIALGLPSARGTHLVKDANGDLWLATGASLTDDSPGHLLHIAVGDTIRLLADYPFPQGQSPGELTLNGNRDSLFWLNDGVYAMSITATALPDQPLITDDGLFYGLGVDPETSEIFVADAIDYVQQGVVLRHGPRGDLRDEFRVGVIPGAFYFR